MYCKSERTLLSCRIWAGGVV